MNMHQFKILLCFCTMGIAGCNKIGNTSYMDDGEESEGDRERLGTNRSMSDDSLSSLLSDGGFTLQEIEELCKEDNPNASTRSIIFNKTIDRLLYIKDASSTKGEKYIKILRYIRNLGFDINKLDSGGGGRYHNTYLMWCISCGKAVEPTFALVLLSEDFNANPFIPDVYGKNALHFLLLQGHEVQRCIVDSVLNRKDSEEHINDLTICGDTPMHIACARRDVQFIAQLLKKGASLEIKNHDGLTPIDVLHLDEKQRLNFLIKENQYLDLSGINHKDEEDKLAYVATINKEIFNLDPFVIEKNIRDC